MAAASPLPRVRLVHGPTPLVKHARLDAWLGVDLWVKRDDATSGAETGNKVRKLELLLGDALAQGADTVVTCGGLQSNHARATALCAAGAGLASVLLLRDEDPARTPLPLAGNVLLDRLAGADVRLVSRADYARRGEVMEAVAAELRAKGRRPYVIPEGGSNGLGSLGYVDAMGEVRAQLDAGQAGGAPFDLVVHACGSGGTAAGIALGLAKHGVAEAVRPVAVCDDAAYFERTIARIVAEARALDASLPAPARCGVDDRAKGPAYGVASPEQRATIVRVAREAGLVLDPVYTGKAMHGLAAALERGDVPRGARVLFVHTGGLPGLLAQGDVFAPELG